MVTEEAIEKVGKKVLIEKRIEGFIEVRALLWVV